MGARPGYPWSDKSLETHGLAALAGLRSGGAIVRVVGQNVVNVVSRLMGLILAVIGMQMLIDGIRAAVKGQ